MIYNSIFLNSLIYFGSQIKTLSCKIGITVNFIFNFSQLTQ